MENDDLFWSDCKDVEFHSGFLQRAKEGKKWVQSVIEAEKPKKVILCGHSLGGAISGTHTYFHSNLGMYTYSKYPCTFHKICVNFGNT